MQIKRTMSILCAIVLLGTPVSAAVAEIPAVYTNDNFFSSEHDQPVSFESDMYGNFWGVTTSGKTFRQFGIVNDFHVRLQRFEIDQAYFYVSDYGIILAATDTAALSIYLTKAGLS